MTLFRREALEQAQQRLYGDVAVALPPSWQAIGYLLFTALVVAVVFVGTSSFARTVVVDGTLVPDRGVFEVTAARSGVVTAVATRNGARTTAGTPLVELRSPERLAGGGSLQDQLLDALKQQDAELAAQGREFASASAAEEAQLAAQAEGLRVEMEALASQIQLQERLVASAADDLERAKAVSARGFISVRDVRMREEASLSAQKTRMQLVQGQAAKRYALAEVGKAAAAIRAKARAQDAQIRLDRSSLTREAASADAAGAYQLTAPVTGNVTALTVRVGQYVDANHRLMTVVPDNARLRAEFLVPSSAIGFLAAGQRVRLALDAFPYLTFGALDAKIADVSAAPIRILDREEDMYVVTANLPSQTIDAFGKSQRLLPGMKLSARIVLREQSLLQWLFEPLYAVSRR